MPVVTYPPAQLAAMPDKEVVQVALRGHEARRSRCVAELQARGTESVFELAKSLLEGELSERTLGCEVLGQLGFEAQQRSGQWPFREEAYPLIVAQLKSDEPTVIATAAVALSHQGPQEGLASLIPHASHPDPHVRVAVAIALAGASGDEACAVLVKLSDDPDAEVRNWATFALSSYDSPAALKALRARLDDESAEVRREAMYGLSRLGDPEANEAVSCALRENELDVMTLEAAIELANPVHLSLLQAWRPKIDVENTDLGELLDAAIETCLAASLPPPPPTDE